MSHMLVVHEHPDDGYEVDHLPSCPVQPIKDDEGHVMTWEHRCDLGRLESEVGFDFLRWENYRPGRYYLEVWVQGLGDLAEMGVMVIDENGLTLSACPCHPVEQDEIDEFTR